MPLSPSISATDARSLTSLIFGVRLMLPAHIKRQPDHAMRVAAAQIGFHHQVCDDLRVAIRQPGGNKSARRKCGELSWWHAAVVARRFLCPCALIHFQSIPKPMPRP